MATGKYSWSQTAATNATADSTINWAEGQAPSTVNDSSRAQMAILAKWRDDISGVQPSNVVQTTAGTADAQTIATTNGSIAALTNGWTLTFKAGFSNTSACTFAPDGLTAKQIQQVSGSNLTGGEIVAGCVYTVTYHQPTDTWVLHNPTPAIIKVGGAGFSAQSAVNIVLTSFTNFRCIKIVFDSVTSSTTQDLYIRTSTDGGSNYDAGATDYSYAMHYSKTTSASMSVVKDNEEAFIYAGFGAASSGDHMSMEYTLWKPQGSFFTHITGVGAINYLSELFNVQMAGNRQSNANVDAIRFLPSTGTFSGTYAVYGLS
jgi:hypothetical protein